MQIRFPNSPIGNPDVGDVGPGHVVAGDPVAPVVGTQPVLLHLQEDLFDGFAGAARC